jgi:hypothetical protein
MTKARTTIICYVGLQLFGIASTNLVAVLAQFPSTMFSHSAEEVGESLQLQFQHHVFVKGYFLGYISKSLSNPKLFIQHGQKLVYRNRFIQDHLASTIRHFIVLEDGRGSSVRPS